jgi:hypothetical protein
MSNPFLGENAAVPAESSGERPHRHAIEQAARRWRGGRRGDSGRTRRKIFISAQLSTISIRISFLPNMRSQILLKACARGARRAWLAVVPTHED